MTILGVLASAGPAVITTRAKTRIINRVPAVGVGGSRSRLLTWLPHKLAFILFISRMPTKGCTIRGAPRALRTPTQGRKLILPQIALAGCSLPRCSPCWCRYGYCAVWCMRCCITWCWLSLIARTSAPGICCCSWLCRWLLLGHPTPCLRNQRDVWIIAMVLRSNTRQIDRCWGHNPTQAHHAFPPCRRRHCRRV